MQNNLFNCDILVVGAGAAGCAAAVTAAENCCLTLLIDRCSSLGGTYRAARLNTVCGLYLSHADDNILKTLPCKFIERWLSRVQAHDKSFMPRREGRLYTAPCNSELMTVVLAEAIAEQSKHLTYMPSTELDSVKFTDNIITEVNAVTADGKILTIRPKTVIDCSGNGAVITKTASPERRTSNAEHSTSNKAQQQSKHCKSYNHGGRKSLELLTPNSDVGSLASIPFTLTNCPYSEMLSLKTAYELSQLAKQNQCPHYWRFVVLRKGSNNEINGWFNFPPELFNSATEVKTEICSMFELLCERLVEFKSARLSWSGNEICRRDAPVIDGMNCLTADDIINGTKQADATLCGSWPIELWDTEKGQQLIYPPINDYYNIPDDCLKSAFCSNLFAAGKGVSATPEAQAAIRVTGLAFATGERAAILAIKHLN
jgi:ribulose 1,5-bisphosphate synthetase/thiazole synthase